MQGSQSFDPLRMFPVRLYWSDFAGTDLATRGHLPCSHLRNAICQCTYHMRSGHLLQSSLALGTLLVWLPICLLPPWSHSTGSAVVLGSPSGGCCQLVPSGWDSQLPVLPREQGSAGYWPSTGFHRSPLHQHRKSVNHSSNFWAHSQKSSWRNRSQLRNSLGKQYVVGVQLQVVGC